MKTRSLVTLSLCVGVALCATARGGAIDISTGVALWQLTGGTATTLTVGQQNGTWAPAPAGSAWISSSSSEGTSCVVGQTPGNGCATALTNPAGDLYVFTLTVSAASLGTTSGSLNYIFGADSDVSLAIGLGGSPQLWNSGSPGAAFNPLGCSGTPPTSAGNTQGTYNTCTGTVNFNAANLNGDGSLTLSASVTNAPIVGCPACGDPMGFVLEGDILTGGTLPPSVPEPATFGLMAVAGAALIARRFVTKRS